MNILISKQFYIKHTAAKYPENLSRLSNTDPVATDPPRLSRIFIVSIYIYICVDVMYGI